MKNMIEIEDPLKSYMEFPGPILLLAGPGTGKTFQLAHRVKFLLDTYDAAPEEICIITFTSVAAKNMRERLKEPDFDIIKAKQPCIISTMHSLGNSIIGYAPKEAGLSSDYRVLTNQYVRKVLMQDASFLVTDDRELWKETDQCRKCGTCTRDTSAIQCKICTKYIEILRKCSAIDYDDQILLACELLEKNKNVAAYWRSKTRHLLVDEYQDINQAQFRLIQLLSEGQTDGLFVVGDDDQSIYSFRGGTPSYIQEFSNQFTGQTKIGRLSKSWRCPEHILRGAKSIINKFYPGSVAKPEPTFSKNLTNSKKIKFWNIPSDSWEGNLIAKEIQSLSEDDRVIVIVPNSKYFPPIRDALKNKGISYRYKSRPSDDGIVRFTLLANWVENPDESLSMRHLLNLIIQNHNDLLTSVSSNNKNKTEKRIQASNLLSSFWDTCKVNRSLYQVITEEADKHHETSFLKSLKKDCLDKILSLIKEHGGKGKYLPEFLMQVGLMIAPGKNAKGIIDEIREWGNELFDYGTISERPPVEIYSIQSSKGLEGDVVFVVGATNGVMPDLNKDLEEQARLFYVAMTRAKKELHLLSSRTRPASITFRKSSYQMKPSQFIKTIPIANLESKYIQRKNTQKEKNGTRSREPGIDG
jgi:DNA helicase-2/ATP-dependent DNA helicase PcrA